MIVNDILRISCRKIKTKHIFLLLVVTTIVCHLKYSDTNWIFLMKHRTHYIRSLLNRPPQIYHWPNNFSKPGQVDDVIGMEPLPLSQCFKNPCWYEKQDGKTLTLRCLPYVHIIGVDKCGTTDLFSRLARHPELLRTDALNGKETHWWSWRRFGYDVFSDYSKIQTFEDYVKVFDRAARILNTSSENSDNHIICDGSPTVFWDFTGWPLIPQNKGLKYPQVLTPHCISHLTPNAKFILILRNPVERLFSDYLFLQYNGPSVNQFDDWVKETWSLFNKCKEQLEENLCLFNKSLHMKSKTRLLIGMYSTYLKEWFKVFPRNHFLIIRTEDYKQDMNGTLKKIFDFLGMQPLTGDKLNEIVKGKHAFERTSAQKKIGPMLESTKKLLYEIYTPYMEELAVMLNDEKFHWKYS